MFDHSYPTTFPADGPIGMSVRQTSGDLTVTATDTDQVTVDVRASGRNADDLVAATTVEYRDGALRIEAPRSTGLLGGSSVDINVTLPAGSTADLQSGSGDVVLDGELGAVAAKAGSGVVTIASCADARLQSGSGGMIVRRCASIVAHAGSGDVRIGEVDGRVDVETGSGDIEVSGRITGGRASTGSGDVEVGSVEGAFDIRTASGEIGVRRAVEGQLQATAASGNVSVAIADGTAAHLDVSSVTGHVLSDLDEADAPDDSDRKLFLTVRTVSGSIRLHRAH